MVPLANGDACWRLSNSYALLPPRSPVSPELQSISFSSLSDSTACRYVRHLESELDSHATSTSETQPAKRKRLFSQTEFRCISPDPMSFLGFFRFLYMLKYPSVFQMAFAWCIGVAMPDIGISSIVPLAFGGVYGWDSSAQGLSNAGFLIGCIIGEAFAGSVSKYVSGIFSLSKKTCSMTMIVHPLANQEERRCLRSRNASHAYDTRPDPHALRSRRLRHLRRAQNTLDRTR